MGIQALAQNARNLTGRVGGGVGGFRVNEVDDGLSLREIHLAIQKRALGKFARPGLMKAALKERGESGGQDGGEPWHWNSTVSSPV